MNNKATACSGGAARNRRGAGRLARRVTLVASIAALAMGVAPSLAQAIAPYVSSSSASPSATGATLNASIYPYGADTHYHFEYGTTTAYGTSVPMPEGDAGSAAYPGIFQASEAISGLAQGTTYHFRLVASSSLGTATGPGTNDGTFTTTGTPPTVLANPATETTEGFQLSGSVNPNGFDAKYHFEYGTTTAYGTNIPASEADVGSGSSAVTVSQEAKSLLPNTTYHFRLTAHGTGTSAATPDQTFTTPPSGPAAPSAVVEAPQPISSGRLQAEGRGQPERPGNDVSLRIRQNDLIRDEPPGRRRRHRVRDRPGARVAGSDGAVPRHDLPLPDRRDQLQRADRQHGRGVHDGTPKNRSSPQRR